MWPSLVLVSLLPPEFIREALTSHSTGPGGLSILKNLREEGFDVTVYEKRNEVGGVWAYSDDENTTSTLPCKSIRYHNVSSPANIVATLSNGSRFGVRIHPSLLNVNHISNLSRIHSQTSLPDTVSVSITSRSDSLSVT
jgi:hypothetical protein